MNRKGFTLVELLATLVILGIVVGISIYSMNGGFSSAKSKSEDVFVGTIRDALDIYLSSDAKSLDFSSECRNTLNKTYGSRKVYMKNINFEDVIDSKYKPITQKDLVNPANKEACDLGEDIVVSIYRDEDFVYYYSVNESSFGCLNGSEEITNLPEGYECGL